jgi:hypothetical protein
MARTESYVLILVGQPFYGWFNTADDFNSLRHITSRNGWPKALRA